MRRGVGGRRPTPARAVTRARPWRRPDRVRGAGDAGITLIEVVVSMSIMAVFMALFTTGILQIFDVANKTESMTTAQSQVNTAFLRLDKEIRYAAAISTPAPVSGSPYVEYLTTSSGVSLCTELRLNRTAMQLQRRTWTQGVLPLVPSGWLTLASGVTSATPFALVAADAADASSYQQLRISLVVSAGGSRTATTRTSDITFTAMNTTMVASNATTCVDGRAIA